MVIDAWEFMELLTRDHEGGQVCSVDGKEHHREHRPDVGHKSVHTRSYLKKKKK